MFFAPAFYPALPGDYIDGVNVGLNNFNWSGPLMLVIFLVIGIWWLASAKNWFKGPQVQGSREELLAIERELAAVHSGKSPDEFRRLEAQLDEELDQRIHPEDPT